jgi:hypothetical protein
MREGNELGMALALRADFVEETGATLAPALEGDDVAVDVHVRVVIVKINPVALGAAMNIVVAEGLVAHALG